MIHQFYILQCVKQKFLVQHVFLFHDGITCSSHIKLIDWLMDWLIDFLTVWFINWFIDSLIHWWIDGLMDWWIDSLMDWLIDSYSRKLIFTNFLKLFLCKLIGFNFFVKMYIPGSQCTLYMNEVWSLNPDPFRIQNNDLIFHTVHRHELPVTDIRYFRL